MTALRLLAVTCVLVLVAGACSPGDQDDPEAIGSRDVPFGLLDTTTTSLEPGDTPTGATSVLYFVVDEAIVPVTRTAGRSTVDGVLDLLLEGPTEAEAELGVVTNIPSGAGIDRLTRHGDVLTIDLATEEGAPVSSATLAVAQLVLTATEIPGVEKIRFRVDDQTVQVPEADGTLTDRPVERSDYEALLRR